MALEFYNATPIQVDATGFTVDAYNDVDVDDATYSAISSTVTGLALLVINTGAGTRAAAVRNKDHTTDYFDAKAVGANSRFITPVGLDADRILQVWADNFTDVEFWIIAGHQAESQWHGTDYDTSATSPDDITPATKGSFQSIDITSITAGGDVATGALGQIINASGAARTSGVRPTGSTLAYEADINNWMGHYMVCDGGETFEGYAENTSPFPQLFLTGYMTDGISDSGELDAIPGSEDTFVDYTLDGGSSALGGLFCVRNNGITRLHFERPNGETTGLWADTADGAGNQNASFRLVGVDGSGIIENYRSRAVGQYALWREVATFRADTPATGGPLPGSLALTGVGR